MVHLLIYIRDNNTLGLNYYACMKSAPLSEILIQARIKTKNQLMDFSDSGWQDFSDTDISTGAYIIFYQFWTIYNAIHVPGPVSKLSA